MSEKRFEMVITDEKGNFHYLDNVTGEKITSTLTLENKLNELAEENEQLRTELEMYTAPHCKKCMNYCQDKVSDYCLVDEREPTYFPIPFGWNYKTEAEKCQYYER